MKFTGSITALITPFRNGKFDESAFQSIIENQINSGTHGLVPTGTTGESPTLSHEEHMKVVEVCIKTSSGRVPVIAGTGSNSTEEAIVLTKHAQNAGADAALIVTPYYNKPTQEGLYQHYKAINDNTKIPIIVYNIPGRSIVDVNIDTMEKLYNLKNIIGVKDATSDMSRASQQRKIMGDDFVLLTGEDASAMGFMIHGGNGAISVTANVAPKLCADFQNLCKKKMFKEASIINDKLMPLHQSLFIETSPSPVKYAAGLLGLCLEDLRLPLVPIKQETKDAVKSAMKYADLI